MKGGRSKSSVRPSKPMKTILLGGRTREFCRDIPGLPEKYEVFNPSPTRALGVKFPGPFLAGNLPH